MSRRTKKVARPARPPITIKWHVAPRIDMFDIPIQVSAVIHCPSANRDFDIAMLVSRYSHTGRAIENHWNDIACGVSPYHYLDDRLKKFYDAHIDRIKRLYGG